MVNVEEKTYCIKKMFIVMESYGGARHRPSSSVHKLF